MTLRLHVPGPLVAGAEFALPADAARHAQVRRVQPGDALVLFDGKGHEAQAEVTAMSRRDVTVRVLEMRRALERELPLSVTLAFGMPANERMDALVEKATELGAAVLQPLVTARSVLRLDGERAERRRAHWQAVAVAACEQSGRAVAPVVAPVCTLDAWLVLQRDAVAVSSPAPVVAVGAGAPVAPCRWLLSTQPDAAPWSSVAGPAIGPVVGATGARDIVLLSGPEGGFEPAEAAAAQTAGFVPVSLGARVLRADTAPLAALAALALALPARAAADDGPDPRPPAG